MEKLKKHVDRLFAGYGDNAEIREMKDEILTNLEAKVADAMEEGLSRGEAIALAIRDIDRVDFLIEGHFQAFPGIQLHSQLCAD